MRDHNECIKGYHIYSKAWYKMPNEPIEINFGMYHPDGGTSGEMCIRWEELEKGRLSAKLISWHDSWSALSLFSDLIHEMAEYDNQYITEDEFVELLNKCGFKDLTAYERGTDAEP